MTQTLRRHKVVDKFVEYFGPGVAELSLPDRATIANMSPENGATMGFFPVDAETLRYLRLTGRDEAQVALVEAYCKAQGLWRDAGTPPAEFTGIVEIDLSAVEPSVAGPSRPQDRVPLREAPSAFPKSWFPNRKEKDGDVVIAAITSCTNTSNPSVMIGAGLLARNAVARGLKVQPWVKTSLSPGSRVVADYLAKSGLQASLDALGFQPAGFGCMTCMGNSGPLAAPRSPRRSRRTELTAVAVLSGNRNFEGRIHPAVRANFLASPPLVVAYALAGSVLVEPGARAARHRRATASRSTCASIWPDGAEIRSVIDEVLTPALYRERYATMLEGTPEWRALKGETGTTYAWSPGSTFIRRPPFFEDMEAKPAEPADIRGARVLGMFGDMFTTDHISPIGVISKGTPAAEYLAVARRRAGRLRQLRGAAPEPRRDDPRHVRQRARAQRDDAGGRRQQHRALPGRRAHVDPRRRRALSRGRRAAGGDRRREYGAGSSRDWAAKGTRLLGVRAVIAETFERIHRSNLVGMGVLPLQFPAGVTRKTLALKGDEIIDIAGIPAGGAAQRDRVRHYARRRQRERDRTAVAPGHQARGGILPPWRPAAPRSASSTGAEVAA